MEQRKHKKYRSQFRYSDEHADARPLRENARVRDVKVLLHPENYPRLPSNWIHAFLGGNELSVSRRLARMGREPHNILIRHQAWFKHAVYGLTKSDAPFPTEPFSHLVLQCLVMASIELGVRGDPAAQLLKWRDIVALGQIPDGTLSQSRGAHYIPLERGHSKGDEKPFALRKDGEDLFILANEIDRGTEAFESDKSRRTIREKFVHYKEIFDRRLWKTHYGFPNSIVIFYTLTESRMNSMRALAEREIGRPSWLLFAHTRDWGNDKKEPHYPPPPGARPHHGIQPLELYSRPYKRVGHPDFYLNRFTEM